MPGVVAVDSGVRPDVDAGHEHEAALLGHLDRVVVGHVFTELVCLGVHSDVWREPEQEGVEAAVSEVTTGRAHRLGELRLHTPPLLRKGLPPVRAEHLRQAAGDRGWIVEEELEHRYRARVDGQCRRQDCFALRRVVEPSLAGLLASVVADGACELVGDRPGVESGQLLELLMEVEVPLIGAG